MFKINDIVYIENNQNELYKIKDINNSNVLLIGYNTRNLININIDKIHLAKSEMINDEKKADEERYQKIITTNKTRLKRKVLYGRILHIDGDKEFLDSCLKLYKELNIYAYGLNINEKEIYSKITKIYEEITPEIVVITGHDQYNGEDIKNLDNYENTSYFMKAIRNLRKISQNVIIIAGACASNFEALIASGANFASSPKRVNTHTYDPAVAAIKASTTPFDRKIDYNSIIKYIESGKDALGGIETYGTMKLIL